MSKQPVVIKIDMLDTDYAKMVAGEAIAQERWERLEALDPYTSDRLGKQISRYRHGQLAQEGKDNILCDIGLTVELFNQSDMEDIRYRVRDVGYFYLTTNEREQVVNWLKDELAVDLTDV